MSPSQVVNSVELGTATHDDGARFLKVSERKALALGLAATFDDVLNTVPLQYKTALTPGLRALYTNAERRLSVREQYESLCKHKEARTFPSILGGIKVPAFQLGKAFLDANRPGDQNDKLPQLKAIDETIAAAKLRLLDQVILAQKAELDWYDELLTPEKLVGDLVTKIREHWNSVVAPSSKEPPPRQD